MGRINLFYVWLIGVILHTVPMALVFAFNLHHLEKSELLICLKNQIFNIGQNLYFCFEILKCAFFHCLIYQRIGEVTSFYISCNEGVKWNFHESKSSISQFWPFKLSVILILISYCQFLFSGGIPHFKFFLSCNKKMSQ